MTKKNNLLIPDKPVGIVGYGAYVPQYRLPNREISRVWADGMNVTPIQEKAVAGPDEDVITMSIEAARNALKRSEIKADQLRAVWVGSESHPYAVKPSGTAVAEAIGTGNQIQSGDWEFACKAGTEALVAGMGLVGSGMGEYALAIGMDVAQGKPGNPLEYTASAGGAAFIIGPQEEAVAKIECSYSHVSDTPDFWRRAYQIYPEHGHRFTGEPAYFSHIHSAGQHILDETGYTPDRFKYIVLHQPNGKFPQRAAAELGFSREQVKTGLLTPEIGNTYSGAALIGLTAILDEAKPGDRILMVSYGSGAGSDAFIIQATDQLAARRSKAPSTRDYISRRVEIDYALYARWRGKLVLK
ncbi:MAG: hydroxymethylglutaryl-CoA synthase [Anaerolineales bacterium]|nr:hydroxymethylglutaryl-CoA synthase [Anaerolineales bacterium]